VSAFGELGEIAPRLLFEGLAARTVDGERMTLAVIELGPHAVVPEHSHENEQLGVLASGSLRFRVGDEERELGPGSTWLIPAHVSHEVRTGPDGAVAIEVFAPARADWDGIERGEPTAPLWPVPSGRL
jgi:quercetin dioxygenase-like cupin family protein